MRYSNRSSNKYKQLADDDEGGGGGGLEDGAGLGRDARRRDPSSEGGGPRGSGMARDGPNGVLDGEPPDGF